MRHLLATMLLLALAGCAGSGMEKAECRNADWRAIGFEDGAQGRSPEYFGQRRKACAEHGVTAKFDAYLAGRDEGLGHYCRPQNGYRLGSQGYGYAGVCPAALEGAFLAAHGDGYGLYQRLAKVRNLGSRLDTSRQRSREIEYLLAEKTAQLISPLVPAVQRVAIGIELKQLTEERVEIERSIDRLEVDHADAQRDYEAYRSALDQRRTG